MPFGQHYPYCARSWLEGILAKLKALGQSNRSFPSKANLSPSRSLKAPFLPQLSPAQQRLHSSCFSAKKNTRMPASGTCLMQHAAQLCSSSTAPRTKNPPTQNLPQILRLLCIPSVSSKDKFLCKWLNLITIYNTITNCTTQKGMKRL